MFSGYINLWCPTPRHLNFCTNGVIPPIFTKILITLVEMLHLGRGTNLQEQLSENSKLTEIDF